MTETNWIILASASPRRVELLNSAGIIVSVRPGDIDESYHFGETPREHALRLAQAKVAAVAAQHTGRYFIGADTIVVCDGEVMGKPQDTADAVRMLGKLSDKAHDVITSFAVFDRATGRTITDSVCTRVFFKKLREAEIESYVASGCPFDKAGAYAIQGNAAHMIRKIEGSYTNVVGLPLCEVVEALWELGAITG